MGTSSSFIGNAHVDWLSLGAVIAGVAVLISWYRAENAPTPAARKPWLIVRYASVGYIVMWLIVEGPNMFRLLFQGGLD